MTTFITSILKIFYYGIFADFFLYQNDNEYCWDIILIFSVHHMCQSVIFLKRQILFFLHTLDVTERML